MNAVTTANDTANEPITSTISPELRALGVEWITEMVTRKLMWGKSALWWAGYNDFRVVSSDRFPTRADAMLEIIRHIEIMAAEIGFDLNLDLGALDGPLDYGREDDPTALEALALAKAEATKARAEFEALQQIRAGKAALKAARAATAKG